MLALAFLICTTAIGVILSARIPRLRGLGERLAVGLSIAVLVQCWVPFLLARFLGIELGPLVGMLALSAVAFVDWVGFSGSRDRLVHDISVALASMRRPRVLVPWLLVVAVLAGICYLQYWFCLRPLENGGYASAGAGWEDQCGHTAFAASFVYGDNVEKLQYPTFSGWRFGYPFLSDFLVASLVSLGATMSEGFRWSAMWASAAFVMGFYTLARAWLRSDRQAAAALILVLLVGGMGIVRCIEDWVHTGSLGAALNTRDWANDWDHQIHFHNMLTSTLAVMRTSLFGMPVFFAVALILTRECLAAEAIDSNAPAEKLDSEGKSKAAAGLAPGTVSMIVAGVAAGALPLVHAHSYLAAGVFAIGCVCLFRRVPWKHWLWFFAVSGAFSIPQVLFTRQQVVASATPFIRWHLWWMCPDHTPWGLAWYWLQNAGLYVPLVLAALWWPHHARRTRKEAILAPESPDVTRWRLLRRFCMPLLVWWPLCHLIAFQPNEYDNIKLIGFASCGGAILVSALLAHEMRRGRRQAWLGSLLYGSLIITGITSVAHVLRNPIQILEAEGIEFAETVRYSTEPGDILLTGSDLAHPVFVWSGRQIVLGYHGWLMQHGMPLDQRKDEVREIYMGGLNADAFLRKLLISAVVVGPKEKQEFSGLDEEFFARRSGRVTRVGEWTLYYLSPETGKGGPLIP